MAFVRLYDPSRDFFSVLHIFYATIYKEVDFEPARTIGFHLWCRAYINLTPGTCFVLDDGSGRAVGYIIGTLSTTIFSRRWSEFLIPALEPTLFREDDSNESGSEAVKWMKKTLYSAECSMLQLNPELLELYPAHLHINILPEYQSKGWGPHLITAFLNKVKESSAGGVHLGMVRMNLGARRFYERLGFEICGEVLDGGQSGEVGRVGDAICMVKRL